MFKICCLYFHWPNPKTIFMCRPVANFSQKRGIFKKIEIMWQVILRCSYFSENIDKSSYQTFSTHTIYPVLEANKDGQGEDGQNQHFSNFIDFVWIFHAEPKNVGFIFLTIIIHNCMKKFLSKEFLLRPVV
jgi:hypothetical protein